LQTKSNDTQYKWNWSKLEMNEPDPARLSQEFSKTLNSWLSPDQIREVNRRNQTEEYEGVCASHDFCDANEAMAQALERLGFEYHNSLNEIINDAWDRSKAAGFATPGTVKLAKIKREHVNEYDGDFTYVVVQEVGDKAVLRRLHRPENPPITVPTEHVNVFDEISPENPES
jgi:hypothetical protein